MLTDIIFRLLGVCMLVGVVLYLGLQIIHNVQQLQSLLGVFVFLAIPLVASTRPQNVSISNTIFSLWLFF